MDFTYEDIKLLAFLVRTRLKNEARRPRHFVAEGADLQNLKVRQLADLLEKLEEMKTGNDKKEEVRQ